jgi:hypothetical protein
MSQLPRPGEEKPVPVALAWPGFEILDRLHGLGAIQPPAEMLAPNDAEDLDVDDVRSGVIVIGGQPVADRLSPRRSD